MSTESNEVSKGRVVVGVDDSPGSAAALQWALEEAALRNTELVVVNGWFPPALAIPLWAVPEQPFRIEEFEDDSKHLIDTMVDKALGAAPRPPPAIVRHPVRDTPAKALLDTASEADLIVVGSRGRGGFKGLLLGSVSQQIVNHAPCPVVVVRASNAP